MMTSHSEVLKMMTSPSERLKMMTSHSEVHQMMTSPSEGLKIMTSHSEILQMMTSPSEGLKTMTSHSGALKMMTSPSEGLQMMTSRCCCALPPSLIISIKLKGCFRPPSSHLNRVHRGEKQPLGCFESRYFITPLEALSIQIYFHYIIYRVI